VARALIRHRDIMVLTNNLNVANILAANPDCAVIVVGGLLRRTDGGLIGALTAQAIRGFRFDLAIMGCSALDVGGDILDYDIQEVGVSQTILERAHAAWVVADHSKLTRRAPVRIGTLEHVARLYTDLPPPAALVARCGDWGTEIVVAGRGSE
jgi:DeoR family glycerol-3-phosphate regulon repressor